MSLSPPDPTNPPAPLADTLPIRYLVGGRFAVGCLFIKDNLVLVGILLYTYVTVTGIVYSEALYWKIGINPTSFFEAGDFLLAGLRHPVVLGLPVIVLLVDVIFTGIVFLPALWLVKRNWTQTLVGHTGRYLKISPEKLTAKLVSLVRGSMYTNLAISLITAIFPILLLPLISVQALGSCGQTATVLLRADAVGDAEASKPLSRVVLGSVGKMLLVESTADKTYGVIPMEGVREIAISETIARSGYIMLRCAVIQ